jgi:hypothetical protein
MRKKSFRSAEGSQVDAGKMTRRLADICMYKTANTSYTQIADTPTQFSASRQVTKVDAANCPADCLAYGMMTVGTVPLQ